MDIQNYLQDLDQNTAAIWTAVNECNDTTLRAKEEGKWSIIEILEHIYLTDKLVRHIVTRPSELVHETENVVGKEKIRHLLVEGSNRKVAAPNILHPKGDIQDLASMKEMMLTERNLLKENILNQQIVIDNRMHQHPLMGNMTISDWLYFIIHHSQRHLDQIKAIIAEQSSLNTLS